MAKRLSGPTATVTDQRDAISKLEGYPKAPTFIGSAIKHLVPATWDGTGPTPLGWTKHLCAMSEDVDANGNPLGTAKLDVPTPVAARQQGKSTTVNGRTVTVDLRGAADLPDQAQGGGKADAAPGGGK